MEQTVTSVVAERVRKLRASRGWSAQRLADEIKAKGVDWNRGVVTKLETGRRESLSVVELFALALVLGVSPLALLVPDEPGAYPVLPGHEAGTIRVFDWLIGRVTSPSNDDPTMAANPIPSGLPEWLANRERSLIAERGGDGGAQLAALGELTVRYAKLLAEVEQKSSDLDAALKAAEATVDSDDFKQRVNEIVREAVKDIQTGRPSDE